MKNSLANSNYTFLVREFMIFQVTFLQFVEAWDLNVIVFQLRFLFMSVFIYISNYVLCCSNTSVDFISILSSPNLWYHKAAKLERHQVAFSTQRCYR